jgi:hypothetical protein
MHFRNHPNDVWSGIKLVEFRCFDGAEGLWVFGRTCLRHAASTEEEHPPFGYKLLRYGCLPEQTKGHCKVPGAMFSDGLVTEAEWTVASWYSPYEKDTWQGSLMSSSE